MADTLLRVRDLSVQYEMREGAVYAVDSVDFDIHRGSVTALVGESGSGKTTVALSLLKLLPHNGSVTGGTAIYNGSDLLALSGEELRAVRGRSIAMIFQDAVAGLNPVIRVGDQVAEVLTNHLQIGKKDAKRQAVALLSSVGLGDAARIAKSFPFQLSGGMCQRVMVAIATALEPDILIADEPTSSLDVTVQAQVLHELQRLADSHGTGILLITHNLGVVAQVSSDVAVMYGGSILERGDTLAVMDNPRHPYTHGLLSALPRLDSPIESLRAIGGELPDQTKPREHCIFLARCNKALSRCRAEQHPPLERLSGGEDHQIACYNPVWQP